MAARFAHNIKRSRTLLQTMGTQSVSSGSLMSSACYRLHRIPLSGGQKIAVFGQSARLRSMEAQEAPGRLWFPMVTGRQRGRVHSRSHVGAFLSPEPESADLHREKQDVGSDQGAITSDTLITRRIYATRVQHEYVSRQCQLNTECTAE